MPHFLVVGGTGFAVDAALLYLFAGFGLHFLLARLLSFLVAVMITFWLNKTWTFADAEGLLLRRSALYLAVQLAGGAVNLGGFWIVAAAFDLRGGLLIVPLIAGSAAAIAVTYSGSRFLAFRPLASPGKPPKPTASQGRRG
ncbi:GtrA family protein [Erythrobacter sp. NFXS35]|uniref:GtrA family protein n=1 Tax=Erythrobacter sp. NFXS35 TaxID=2818436 RepID=UPI0032DF2100